MKIYLWIDADAWVVDWHTIELILEGCRDGSLAMAYDEVDTGFYPGELTMVHGRLCNDRDLLHEAFAPLTYASQTS